MCRYKKNRYDSHSTKNSQKTPKPIKIEVENNNLNNEIKRLRNAIQNSTSAVRTVGLRNDLQNLLNLRDGPQVRNQSRSNTRISSQIPSVSSTHTDTINLIPRKRSRTKNTNELITDSKSGPSKSESSKSGPAERPRRRGMIRTTGNQGRGYNR